MKLYSDDQLLDPAVRKAIIAEIRGTSNVARKTEAKKRHEVFKDNTIKYVMKKLQNEGLDPATLTLMQNRASNISICKKIVNKKAKAYSNGCTRETDQEAVTLQISHLAMLLDFDKRMRKADRFLQLQRNAMPWFVAEECEPGKFAIKMKVLSPWQYDAIERANDEDRPLAIVLSDFYSPSAASIPGNNQRNQVQYIDSVNKTTWTSEDHIARSPAADPSEDSRVYIFWSDKYHFSCSANGEIIPQLSPELNLNPYEIIPGVPQAIDRDEGFWAGGGEDLADGSILINTMVTDMNAIMFMQGWGQMVIIGDKGMIPKRMETGPHRAIVLTTNPKREGTPPKVEIISSNPPISDWMASIEQYVALLLSTNNLSPRNVAGKLDANNMASGLAMLIDNSDSTEDVREQQSDFSRYERQEWKVYAHLHNRYHEARQLDDEFQAVGKLPEPKDLNVNVRYNTGAEVISEKERLENMKLKKELGLVRQVEMLMSENPGMTEEEAEKKLLKIKEERLSEQETVAREMATEAVKRGGQKNVGQEGQQEEGAGDGEAAP